MSNIYYHPEAYGLKLVAEGDDPDANYSFDMMVVWYGHDTFWVADDSGCSCPSPFDSMDLSNIEKLPSKQHVYNAIDAWTRNRIEAGYDPSDWRTVAWQQVGLQMKQAVRDFDPRGVK